MEKIKRSLFATFINTSPSGEAEVWARMGKGITSQKISYNPNVTTEQYIDEDNATSSVDSYAPSLDGSQTCYKGEPVFTYIDGLRQKRAVGKELETQVLRELGKRSGLVIATGGGCVTREENYPLLHQNGTIFWLTRELNKLPTNGRPLSQANSLADLYEQRAPLYDRFTDYIADNDGSLESVFDRIVGALEVMP